jgi:hypothetical protein
MKIEMVEKDLSVDLPNSVNQLKTAISTADGILFAIPKYNYREVFVHVKEGLFDDAGSLSESNVRFFQKWMDNYMIPLLKTRSRFQILSND